VLGIQHIHGTKRVKRDYARAKSSFERALMIDPRENDANYYMGLIYLMGLGVQVDITKALNHFEIARNDSRAINAIGYIYFKAPDYLEKDPALLNTYGTIRRDLKKAKEMFDKSAAKGNVNAMYNLGCFYLSKKPMPASLKNISFSFSEAYDHFKQAAEKGHTFSAYNVAVMHFLGVGTFESCQIAQTFLKHVADVGQNTQELKTAYSLVLEHRPMEAAMIYMELAEQGLAVAQLNAAVLLDKYNIFQKDTSRLLLGKALANEKNITKPMNINKQLAFRYY